MQGQGLLREIGQHGVTQAQVARTHHISKSTIQRWVKRYRENGLTGLADTQVRSDKGKSRRLPPEALTLIEGLALQTPPRSMAAIHRQICTIAQERGWKPPSYDRVRHVIKNLDPALVTLAHQGAAAYREEFDLLYRREATHANAQAGSLKVVGQRARAQNRPVLAELQEPGNPAKFAVQAYPGKAQGGLRGQK